MPPRNRNKEIRTVRVADISNAPFNFREHPDIQRSALAGVVDEIGWYGYPVVSALPDGSLQLIDGALRKEWLVERYGDEVEIEVNVTDFNEAEAKKALATHDPLAALATHNADGLASLLTDLTTDNPAVQEMWDQMAANTAAALVDPHDAPADDIPQDVLNGCWREWANEVTTQILELDKTGWQFSGITPAYAKLRFLRSLYLGVDYPRHCSIAFHPQQVRTSGDCFSVFDGLKKVANGEIKAERLQFVMHDTPKVSVLLGTLAMGGSRMPIDFPALTARDLIQEFGADSVLDPTHGWGGRLVGFLLSSASRYVGIDVSPEQHEGVSKVASALEPLSIGERDIELRTCKFEEASLDDGSFDFAITSPPYYDTEQYVGGDQSHQVSGYEQWRSSFYYPLIERTCRALKPDGVFVLNVGSQRYPLLADGKEIAANCGFSVEDVRDANIGRPEKEFDVDNDEVLLVLRKKTTKELMK